MHLLNFARLIASIFLGLNLASFALSADKPKLVVAISVDQLAWHVVEANRANFAEDGLFRRVEKEGATFTDAHHRHAFTYTAPGHSVLLTGTYPNQTGVIGNEWYVPEKHAQTYCVDCDEATIVDGLPPEKGKGKRQGISPRVLQAETLGDVMKEASGGKAKVFGISFKDRAGVLMAGRKADAAYWFSGGKWVTSDYYRPTLPAYIRYANDSGLNQQFGGKTWTLLLDEAKYRHPYADDAPFESNPAKLGRGFPHKLAAGKDALYEEQLPCTPFGSELTLQMAKMLISEEQLGQDDVTDFIAVGLSPNDYVGHAWGPDSLEAQDITIRTDRMLGDFARFLDEEVGAGKWVLALSADHGICPIPEFLQSQGIAAKRKALGDINAIRYELDALLVKEFGPRPNKARYIPSMDASQVYFTRNPEALTEEQRVKARQIVRDALAKNPAIFKAVTKDEALAAGNAKADPLMQQFFKTCHPTLSGDVLFALQPHYIQSGSGTTHGSPWDYDSHVPLLFLGAGIKPGKFATPASTANLAPTLAASLGLRSPAQAAEPALREALQNSNAPATNN